MSERVRVAVLWVVVAVLAILALLAPGSASAPAPAPASADKRVAPVVVPVTAVEHPPAPAVTGDDLAVLASGATCVERLAAVERLRVTGDPVAVPALATAARTDPCIASAARAAIRELGRADATRW
jgi:hypothetical protein